MPCAQRTASPAGSRTGPVLGRGKADGPDRPFGLRAGRRALRDTATLAQARGAFRGREAGESWQRALVRHILATYLLENGISQADRYSMAAGVEARLPFVDYKLVEHAVGLNDTQPDAVAPGKQWLRAAVAGEIPAWVLNRPKRGSRRHPDWVAAWCAPAAIRWWAAAWHPGCCPMRAQRWRPPSGAFDRGLRDQLGLSVARARAVVPRKLPGHSGGRLAVMQARRRPPAEDPAALSGVESRVRNAPPCACWQRWPTAVARCTWCSRSPVGALEPEIDPR
ncbi:MAG: hypothetical protein IPQ20_03505 [Thermomonas sp.]|nr:hypothetical protein [Thermomonas sp.]